MKIVMAGLSGTIQISERMKRIPANKRIGDMQAEITRLKNTIAEIAS